MRRRQVSARVRLRDCNSVMISWVRVDNCGVAVALDGRWFGVPVVLVVLVLLPIVLGRMGGVVDVGGVKNRGMDISCPCG